MTQNEFTKAYEREDHLGGGGFGQVFKAYDTINERYVAIKRSEVKPEFKDFTLMREYELAKEIPQHPNICPYENCFRFFDGFIDADYAILKYYEYGNISEFLEKQTLSDREKKQLIKGILQGVEHLHKNNIIHRDLKAGNILIDREDGVWRPKITDFGLSKITDQSQITKSLHNSSIGVSYHYAAPEQIEGAKNILPNVDLWAVGVLIYQILTGEMPFYSDNPDTTINQNEVAKKVTQTKMPAQLAALPEPYQSMIRECWVKDPKERIQKADILIAKLDNKKSTTTTKSVSETKPKTIKKTIKPSTEKSKIKNHTNAHSEETKIAPNQGVNIEKSIKKKNIKPKSSKKIIDKKEKEDPNWTDYIPVVVATVITIIIAFYSIKHNWNLFDSDDFTEFFGWITFIIAIVMLIMFLVVCWFVSFFVLNFLISYIFNKNQLKRILNLKK